MDALVGKVALVTGGSRGIGAAIALRLAAAGADVAITFARSDHEAQGVVDQVTAAGRHLPDGGRIISIGSNLAERVPFAGVTLYAMSKSALIGFTKGLARDLGAGDVAAVLTADSGANA